MLSNRKTTFILAIVALLALACGIGAPVVTTTVPSDPHSVETLVAGTMQALTAAAPPATGTPAPQNIPVSFQNVSFVIPEGLASGASGELVPAVTEETGAPWDVGPEHIRFSFSGYDDSLGKFSGLEIRVYPVLDETSTSWMGNSLTKLRAVLASPSAPVAPKDMPSVPYFNAAQMIAAQTKVLTFQSGTGVRAITQYGQAVGPISNNGTFYLFVGLTSDGQHYVVAVLPIGADFLPNSYDPAQPAPPNAIPFPDYTSADPAEFEAYFQAVTDQFNAADPTAFTPSLPALDALVQSITVNP
ncbi:MAG: hypothetical protein HY869_08505 [Chloroflexi bacterium]|nr:hypothetical protein [Chloroflexota bacterium]